MATSEPRSNGDAEELRLRALPASPKNHLFKDSPEDDAETSSRASASTATAASRPEARAKDADADLGAATGDMENDEAGVGGKEDETAPVLEYDTPFGWVIVVASFFLLFLSCGLQCGFAVGGPFGLKNRA